MSLATPVIGSGEATTAVVRRSGFARRNWLVLTLVGVGVVLRLLTWLAYQPALIYIDSFRYLDNLSLLQPNDLDPIGYDLFVLKPLFAFGGIGLVAAVQHLAGLGMGLMINRLALRFGARRWVAALAAAPVLLDAYQLQIEQNIMSDVWMQFLLLIVVWLLIGRSVPTPRRAGMAGVLIAAAVIVRLISVTMVLPAVLYLLVAGAAWQTRAGWRQIGRRCAALLAGFVIGLAPYVFYFHGATGRWGITSASGNVSYGRAAVVADCTTLQVSDLVRELCPHEPLGARLGVDVYAHSDGDPNWPGPIPPGTSRTDLQQEFASAVFRQQPLDVAGEVLRDFAKGFAPTKTSAPNDVPVDRWQFQTTYPLYDTIERTAGYTQVYGGAAPSVNVPIATVLRGYQLSFGYTPGLLLAGLALLGLLGSMRKRSGIRAATLLVTGSGLLILFASAVFEFSWRYQLPALVLLPLGGVLGLNALLGPVARPKPVIPRPKLAEFPDDVDASAVSAFAGRYGEPRFAPVLVVIAAYNEQDGIGGVLDDLPRSCCGLDVDVLVVVDGCSDDTGKVALAHGAYTCIAPENRGQGAALRLGYRLAERFGAQYVVTTDADGQYDNDEMPALLQPLLDGDADFVTGSRRLGAEHTDDRVRWAGVRFFAWLCSLLTRRRITDTSFGFRAMRTSLAGSVRLRQPQYQASELLVGSLASGARLLERPMTMRQRTAGTTKKGNNLVYGVNYARAMTGTWLREYVFRRRTRGSAART